MSSINVITNDIPTNTANDANTFNKNTDNTIASNKNTDNTIDTTNTANDADTTKIDYAGKPVKQYIIKPNTIINMRNHSVFIYQPRDELLKYVALEINYDYVNDIKCINNHIYLCSSSDNYNLDLDFSCVPDEQATNIFNNIKNVCKNIGKTGKKIQKPGDYDDAFISINMPKGADYLYNPNCLDEYTMITR